MAVELSTPSTCEIAGGVRSFNCTGLGTPSRLTPRSTGGMSNLVTKRACGRQGGASRVVLAG
eukprot:12436745-Alexandrium_andersonii.AAC.1